MKDPVSLLSDLHPYDPEKILATACGKAYAAIMLSNGRIGVCSTLGNPVKIDPLLVAKPDLKQLDHRILVTAFANAHINYEQENLGSGDIFDQVSFSKNSLTVMIGYFPPLAEKFRKDALPFAAFDQLKEYPDLTPMDRMDEMLGQSDCVIMTATTLINNTLIEISPKIKPGTRIFLLGPSTPLSPSVKQEYNITCLFGMTFRPYDFEVLEIISQGLGTQAFSKKGKKVSL